ncbi:hypothetical protein ACFLT2_07845 [Acidobacteriota bacterium]
MMFNRQRLSKFFGFCVVVFALAIATNALMIKIPLKQLVIESEAIVLGKVQSVRCEWSLDKRLILSIVRVRVQDTMRGDLMVPDIILEVPGGTMGDLSLKVTNMPTFHENEEIVIFLRSIKNLADTKHSFTVAQNYFPAYEVYGKAQGKYSIDAEGMAIKSGYETVNEDKDPENFLPIESLKTQIHLILREDISRRQRKR